MTINGGTLVASSSIALGYGNVTFGTSGGTLRAGVVNGTAPTIVSGFGGGFGAGANQWTGNNNAVRDGIPAAAGLPVITGGGKSLQLTDANGTEATSAYYNTPVSVGGGFTANYTFTEASGQADGAAFVLQTQGLNALGDPGGAIGYGGATAVMPSAAFEIEAYNNGGVLWATNGTTGGDVSMATSGGLLNGANGVAHPFNVNLSYNPSNTTMTAILTDQVNGAVYTYTSNAANLATLFPDGTAYLGFSGGTGGSFGANTISNFTYTNTYTNSLTVNPGVSSTIDVAATAASPVITMGQLTAGAGSQLNVTASTVTAAGQAYGLTLGNATLSGQTTFNVSNAAGGGAGTLRLGTIFDGTSPASIAASGPGTVVLGCRQQIHGGHDDLQRHRGGLEQLTVGKRRRDPRRRPLADSSPRRRVESDRRHRLQCRCGLRGWRSERRCRHQRLGGQHGRHGVCILSSRSGRRAVGTGLPTNRTFVSAANSNVTFQLQPYVGNNVLQEDAATTTVASLTLTNPGQYKNLSILDTGGGGAANYGFTLNFADGSSTIVSGKVAPDWFNNTPVALGGFNRVNVSGAFDPAGYNPRLYEVDYTLAAADQTKILDSITFNYASGGFLSVFGVSGTAAATTLSNAMNVTASSTVNVTGPASASLAGTVQIGNTASTAPITLAITGGSTGANAPYSLYLGTYPNSIGADNGVQLAGGSAGTTQYALDVANNGTGAGTAYLGPLTDLGNASTLTIQGAGTVVLNHGGTMIDGSTINVGPATGGPDGGNLRIGTASGIYAAGSAAINVNNGGTLGLSAGAAQGALGGLVTVKSGGTLLGASGTQLLPSGGLTLGAGSVSTFTLGTPNGTANALIETSGGSGTSLEITGAGTINVSNASVLPLAGGTFDLFSYTGSPLTTTSPSGMSLTFTNGGGGSLTLGNQPLSTLYSYSLENNSALNQIDLILTPVRITWTGTENGNGTPNNSWDTTTTNWANLVPAPVNFNNGSPVRFQDTNVLNGNALVPNTAGVATVNIDAGGVQTPLAEFDNTGFANGGVDYVLTGGPIADSASPASLLIVGNGSLGGTVTLNNSNTLSGSIQITLGSLVAANPTALGNSSGVTVTATGGALVLESPIGGSVSYGNAQSGSGTVDLTLNGSGNAAYPGADQRPRKQHLHRKYLRRHVGRRDDRIRGRHRGR